MKKTAFVLLPIAALVSAQVAAENLELISVVSENTGAKSKTNIVTGKEINKSTETDLRGLLREEPSINFGGGVGHSQWLTIRGMAEDQVDLKVDNTYSDTAMFHHQGRFMMLDPSLIKRVNVQKGTGSASAGIGATSGQIVATTVDAKDLLKDGQNLGFKLTTTYSTNKNWAKGGSVYGKYENIDALFSGNWVDNREYKDGNNQIVNRSGLGQRSLLSKIGVDFNQDHRLVFSHRQERYHGERNLREEFDFAQSDDYNKNDPRYRITTEDTSNLQYFGKNVGWIDNIDFNVYYKEVERKQSTKTGGNYETAKVVTSGANLNLDSALGESHMIKYGINWREQEAKPDHFEYDYIVKQRKEDVGLYAEGIWGFGPVTLTTGLRYDYFRFTAMDNKSASDGKLNPSVGLIWEVNPNLSFNVSHNYATRSPRIFEPVLTTGKSRGKQRVISAADDLKAEHSRNTEIGFNYQLSDQLSLSGSYFWQTIDDVVALRKVKAGFEELYNGGKLKNQGYELSAAYRYGGLTLRAGVADSKPELHGSAVDANRLAMLIGRTWTLSTAYKFEQPNIEIGWRGRFVESEKGSPSRGSNTSQQELNRPGYGVSDFFVNWKPLNNDDLNINFALDNAFNKYYKSHSQRTGINSLPEAGRNFRISMNYTF
ncbi:TonB-dependent receptor domain-containing protein [[Pasteurella] aerogenes]